MKTSNGYMTVEEVARYLGFEKQTIYNKIHTKQIPFHKIGLRAVRFKKEEIDNWVKEQQRQTFTFVKKDGLPYRRIDRDLDSRASETTDVGVFINKVKDIATEDWADVYGGTWAFTKDDIALTKRILKERIVQPDVLLRDQIVYDWLDASHTAMNLALLKLFNGSLDFDSLKHLRKRMIENVVRDIRFADPDEACSEGEEDAYTEYNVNKWSQDLMEPFFSTITYFENIGWGGRKNKKQSAYVNRYIDKESLWDLYVRGFCYYIYDQGEDYSFSLKDRSIEELDADQLSYGLKNGLYAPEQVIPVLRDRVAAGKKELERSSALLKEIQT